MLKRKFSYDYVKSEIEKVDGYKLLSDEYVNTHTKLKIKHDIKKCGFEYEVRFHDFKDAKQRCPKCAPIRRADRLKYDYCYVKKYIESLDNNEYKLLSNEYINNHTKLKIKHDIDKCGYEYEVSFANFKNRESRCPVCSNKKCSSVRALSYEHVKKHIELVDNNEYKLLSDEYTNARKKIKVKHDIEECGFEYEVGFDSFKNKKSRCPKCQRDKQTSPFEQEVVQCAVNMLDPYEQYETHNRDQVFNHNTGHFLELDFFLKGKNKAIECNSYYHSFSDSIEKDRMKIKQCKEKGIDLLIIWYDMWINYKDKCKEIIYNFLNDINISSNQENKYGVNL